LRVLADQHLRTRRFLDYYGSRDWAHQAAPVVDAFRERVDSAPTSDLALLIQRALGTLVRVILNADDSDGLIGGLASDLLELHASTCDRSVVEPVKLAKWIVRFCVDDQDFFVIDPKRYAASLGERGLTFFGSPAVHVGSKGR
jgi:hypothetical protein